MRMLYFIWRALAAFYFLLMTYYFFSLHNGDVRQKQIREIFLSEFKMGPKATEMPCNMNNGFGPGTADEPVKGYIKGWRVLKMRSDHQGQSPYDCTGSCQRTQHVGQPLLCTCEQIKYERLDNWVSHKRTEEKNQENNSELSSFRRMRNNEPFLGRTVTMWQKDCIWQLVMPYLVDGLRSAKAFPKDKLVQENKPTATKR